MSDRLDEFINGGNDLTHLNLGPRTEGSKLCGHLDGLRGRTLESFNLEDVGEDLGKSSVLALGQQKLHNPHVASHLGHIPLRFDIPTTSLVVLKESQVDFRSAHVEGF